MFRPGGWEAAFLSSSASGWCWGWRGAPSLWVSPPLGVFLFRSQAVEFLSKALDSPDIKAVDEAVILLQEIGEP